MTRHDRPVLPVRPVARWLPGQGCRFQRRCSAGGVGSSFSSDGGTLRWLTEAPGVPELVSWRPGEPAASRVAVRRPAGSVQPVGPFLVDSATDGRLLDTRNGRELTLPCGWLFVLDAGTDLVVETGGTKFGAAGSRRVPLADLPPVSC